MGKRTKYQLADALFSILEKQNLDKITISQLTEECGLNRMTFYYHFQDIYDLLEWTITKMIAEQIANTLDKLDWHEAMLNIYLEMQRYKTQVLNIYHSSGREQAERYLYQLLYNVIHRQASSMAKDVGANEDELEFISEFYSCALMGVCLRWIQSEKPSDPEEMIRRLHIMYDGNMRRALKNLSTDRRQREALEQKEGENNEAL